MSITMTATDRICAVLFFGLGAAMLVGGYQMDRLEMRRIDPASIPGLVPILLGALLMLCALLLWKEARQTPEPSEPFMQGGSWQRLGLSGGLCVIYAVVLVGWWPYWLATATFVTAFSLVFSWRDTRDRAGRIRAGLGAVALGGGVALIMSVLFSEVFLVRLP